MKLPVAILAGGRATRLGPIAEGLPKALVDVAGRPFVAHQLALLQRHGYRRVVLCVGHLAGMIEAVVGDGAAWGIEVAYSRDGDHPRGTGGALRRARPLLGERFLVLYGDSYLLCDYAAVETAFRAAEKPGLMVVFRNEGRWDRSNVIYRGGLVLRYDKRNPTAEMRYIDYGLGGLEAGVLENYSPEIAFDLAEVYEDLAARGGLAGYEVAERFYEIGSPEGLEEFRRRLGGGSDRDGVCEETP